MTVCVTTRVHVSSDLYVFLFVSFFTVCGSFLLFLKLLAWFLKTRERRCGIGRMGRREESRRRQGRENCDQNTLY